jgi:hypothetical protein
MSTVTLNVVVGEDRRLTLELPEEIPAGPIEVTIRPVETEPVVTSSEPLTLERARALFAAAGMLSTAFHAPPGTVELTPEERERLGRYYVGPVEMSVLIDEDRGEY